MAALGSAGTSRCVPMAPARARPFNRRLRIAFAQKAHVRGRRQSASRLPPLLRDDQITPLAAHDSGVRQRSDKVEHEIDDFGRECLHVGVVWRPRLFWLLRPFR